MSNFKYIKNIQDGTGEIRIYEPIGVYVKNGKEYGVSGSVFANEMAYLRDNCSKINIRINSEGGNVLDGYAILSSILNTSQSVETESFIDGVAASTAGWCALAANKCQIMDYGCLMVHGASGTDDQELINLANGSIAKIISNRTGMTEDEVKNLMTKETWFKAFNKKDRDTLVNKKFVDGVIDTGKKVKLASNQKNLAELYNKLITNQTMSKVNELLKLSNNAEEAEQASAIEALNKSVTDKQAEIDALKNEIKALKDAEAEREQAAKDALKNKATELVNEYHKLGVLTAEEVAVTIENASKDEASFNFVSNILSRTKADGKRSHKPFTPANIATQTEKPERADWSWSKWSKEDPKGLEKMKNETPELFTELYNKEFNQ